MSNLQGVDVSILGTKLYLSTDKPQELHQLVTELDNHLSNLAKLYPNEELTKIITLACLQYLEEIKKLKIDVDQLLLEKENINKIVHGFLYSIK